MQDKIDFVIIWVDPNDSQWKSDYKKHIPQSKQTDDKSIARYREWDNLRYWFRGVEKFAPWVNKIHFVTYGHYPDWLNLNAPKLNFVKHQDYIPNEYLPVFSSHPIEIHLHRIAGLAEKFVYFNDDLFLINKVNPDHFFKNGLPCDMAVCTTGSPINFMMSHIQANNMYCLNKIFNKKEILAKYWRKWFNLKYGTKILRTICLLPFPHFTLLYNPHLATPYLKSTFEDVWNHFKSDLVRTSHSRFRSIQDNNQYLFRDWQLLTGKFSPYNTAKNGLYYDISEATIEDIEATIQNQTSKILVLNDNNNIKGFEQLKLQINNAFNKILPDKSSFEL